MLSIPSVYMFGPNVCAFSPQDDSLGYNAAFQTFGCWSLATGRECRRLHVSKGPGKRLWGAEASPDNRWLALAREDGTVLYDLQLMVEQPGCSGSTRSAMFDPTGKSLITWGSSGLQRWPIPMAAGNTLATSEPQTLLPRNSSAQEWASLSLDGDIVAAAHRNPDGLFAYDVRHKKELMRAEFWGPSHVALSHDGRFVAASTWRTTPERIHVWNLRAGREVFAVQAQSGSSVSFSPDGKWLVVGDNYFYRSFETMGWTLSAQTKLQKLGDSSAAFSPDSRMLAINWAPGIVRLVDPMYSTVYATLPAGSPLCFSHDGNLLITQKGRSRCGTQVDRQQLAKMGLDWESPRRITVPGSQNP
jgi:WD40 repeat protein